MCARLEETDGLGAASARDAEDEQPCGRPLHVVILGAWMQFPHGMAETVRAQLLAKAIEEAGGRVRVICLQVSEKPLHIKNTALKGTWQGIPYEYSTWTTVRRDSFFARQLVAAWGWLRGSVRLVQLRRANELDLAYLWYPHFHPRFTRYLLLAVLKVLRVPVFMELNEPPWPLRKDAADWECRLSPLTGVSGVVSISDYLTEWALRAGSRRGTKVVEIPIVVDVHESLPKVYPRTEPIVVFAGSLDYRQTIRFVYEAMQRVWAEFPECRLIVTGGSAGGPSARWLFAEEGGMGGDSRVTIAGYLPRVELLDLYSRAHALLIPLFDDGHSRARFPTKIGEYLAAGRPVVTTAIGEVRRYLVDGVNAVVCTPGDPVLYGERIIEVLRDRDHAASIGRRGRELAEARFHYALHAETLYRAFTSVASDHKQG